MAFIRIKDGKYRQLVESYRNERGRVRQRYIKSLGRIDSTKDPFALEPGEVQADKAMTEWVLSGGPERLQQEKQTAWSQEQFLAEAVGPKDAAEAPADAVASGGPDSADAGSSSVK